MHSHVSRALLLLSLAPFAGVALAEPVGTIEALIGEAHSIPPNGLQRELALASAVVQDEYVETAVAGGMTVRFLDGTEFRLGSDSSAVLDRFLYDPAAASGDGVVQLGVGAFRFISSAGQSHDGVRIQTPNSVIGIRGTDFVVLVDRAKGTALGTVSGQIEVTALLSGQVFNVDPGKLGTVQPDGSVTLAMAPVPVDELACWLAQDPYICMGDAGTTGSAPSTGNDLSNDRGGPDGADAGPGPGPGPGPSDGPSPSDPGDDAGDDPGNDPADPGDDAGPGDPNGGAGDPGDGDPGNGN